MLSARISPSILLSEGFCPLGHGKLQHGDWGGQCTTCKLLFKMTVGIYPGHNLIYVKLPSGQVGYGYTYSSDEFDHIIGLDISLNNVRQRLEGYQ